MKYPEGWVAKEWAEKEILLSNRDIIKNCVNFSFNTNDRKKILKYTESLMADIKICQIVSKNDLLSYIQKFGYHVDDYTKNGDMIIWEPSSVTKIKEEMKKITIDGYYGYKFKSLEEPHIDIYINRKPVIYNVIAGWHMEEIDESVIQQIIKTMRFIDN